MNLASAAISRRSLLVGAVGAAALAAAPTASAAPTGRPRTAVVIGSGFGGSVAALRLGEAGVSTTVLERGRDWPLQLGGNTFPSVILPDQRAAWFATNPAIPQPARIIPIRPYPGLIERVYGQGLDAVFGAGVGGGSLVYGSFLPQPRRREWDSLFPSDIPYDEMDRVFYPRALQGIGGSPVPSDVLAAPQYTGARAWIRQAADAGGTFVRNSFGIDWDIVRKEIEGTATPSVTVGEYVYGTNSGAKKSLATTYLKRAQATSNVSIRSMHEVVRIRPNTGGGFTVTAHHIDEQRRVIKTVKLTCDLLIVAAGSFNTTRMLVEARARGDLPNLSKQIGQGFGTNGDFLTITTLQREYFGAPQGGPGVGFMYDDDNPDGPSTIAWEAAPLPWITGGITNTNLIQVMDERRGEVRYDRASGRAILHYPRNNGPRSIDNLGRRAAERFRQRAHVQRGFPLSGLTIDTPLVGMGSDCTWHGLGGVVVGKGANSVGAVGGYDNLYVTDGALLPGSAGMVNPALTITAVAERCMEHLVSSWSGAT